jgi:hypothetical protein
MKNLTKYSFAFLVIVIGISVAQELNIDGDLNVTGTIESVTIDSLNQVIIDLQNQISGMQVENRLETRIFTTENQNFQSGSINTTLDIQSVIGTEIERALISILDVEIDGEGELNLYVDPMGHNDGIIITQLAYGVFPYFIANNNSISYIKEIYDSHGNYIDLYGNCSSNISINFTLAVTAQFPN